MVNELYPIRKDRINKQLYLLVKAVMTMRSIKAFRSYSPEFACEETLNIKQLAYKLKSNHVFLIFPSLHKQFRMYPSEIFKHPAIIAVYSIKYIRKSVPKRDYDFTFKSFYTLDYKEGGSGHYEFTEHSVKDLGDGLPVFADNTMDLFRSLDRLLEYMSKNHLETNEWYKRLKEAQRMLEVREDGIRILHNVGFFDNEALKSVLLSSLSDNHDLNDALSEFSDNLNIFAMSVVNSMYEVTYNYQRVSNPNVVRPQKSTIKHDSQLLEKRKNNSYLIRQQYLKEIIDSKKQQPTYEELAAVNSHEREKELRKENNSRIIWSIVIYTGAMLLLVGALMLAKYSITGSATISVGVISAIIMRTVYRLKEGYEPDDPQPQWFVLTLIFGCIFAIFGGMFFCKWLAENIYTVSNGSITPWSFFFVVLLLMVVLFFYSRKERKNRKGKDARLYICLMVFSLCLTIGQCGGSLIATSDLNQEEWLKNNEEWNKSNEAWEREFYTEKIVGKWMLDVTILGLKQVEEEFFADGTWQRGEADSIICKGEWEYIGDDQIKMRVTWVAPEASLNTSDYVQTLKIYLLDEDKFICQKGDYYITRTRKKEYVKVLE